MIKVGLLSTEFLPVWGGVASYCINLCKALSKNVELHVFTTSRKLEGALLDKDALKIIDDVMIHSISPASDVFFSSFRYQWAITKKLPSLINENKLDLVHSAGPLADQMIRIIGNKIPYLVTYHTTLFGQKNGVISSGVGFSDLDSSERFTLMLYPFLRLYESLSLLRTRRIIAVSKAVKEELIKHYSFKGIVNVIPNGIDVEMFKPDKKKKDNRKRVIFSGRLVAIKGPQLVIEAIPYVLRNHRDTIFTFIGAGNKEPYERMLREKGISKNNYEFYYSEYPNMPKFYNSGDILVLPSLLESFPMSIIEAMACGLPVVASDVGDVAELIKDGKTGYLIRKGDYQALAEKINQILGDEKLQRNMGQNARNLIERRFSLNIMGQKTFKVYQEILEA
ncbi:MAG: glycosyltransferase family 4 protein [Candidatus Methanosuratincola petrocarbonis]